LLDEILENMGEANFEEILMMDAFRRAIPSYLIVSIF
jgi:hypothetical protein